MQCESHLKTFVMVVAATCMLLFLSGEKAKHRGNPEFLDTTILDYYNIEGINPDAHVGFLAIFFLVFFLMAWTTMSVRKYADR
eukprot:1154609-Pelagomonas_calceolata.AAC.2